MIPPDSQNTPPTAQTGQDEDTGSNEWLARARSAFRSSTSYVDGNWRKAWEDSIRAFNNMHPSDSKYNAPAYEKRSRLYRPKVRAIIRKNEAAAAAAFFSNLDVVSVSANDQSDKAQLISSEVMKNLLQYRLTKTIPWYQTVLGGIQDAQTVGVVCAHIHWLYDEVQNVDKPQIDLIPIENIRFDPAASWINVVDTSPYFIHMIPMHAMDIRAKMDSGEWKELPVNLASASSNFDSTRIARNANKEDPQSADTRALGDYEIAWVHRHIHRKGAIEYEFYTLGEYGLLTDPTPLKDVVFHGRRPYVIGSCILETHKAMPSSVPTLARGLADEVNEIANQRIDNVKFALNKKWFAKRGVDVDLSGLVRNVPGWRRLDERPHQRRARNLLARRHTELVPGAAGPGHVHGRAAGQLQPRSDHDGGCLQRPRPQHDHAQSEQWHAGGVPDPHVCRNVRAAGAASSCAAGAEVRD
jgi:hypothetical protein